MRLVEIDVVGAEAAQAVFAGARDRVAIERGVAVAHRRLEPAAARARDLGGEQQRIAPASLHPLADDLFGARRPLRIGRHRIHLGEIDETETRVEGLVEDREALALVGHRAEGHRAEPDLGYAQARAAETSVLHAALLCGNGVGALSLSPGALRDDRHRAPERSNHGCARQHASAASRRSLPQKSSPPTVKLGAPKTPAAAARWSAHAAAPCSRPTAPPRSARAPARRRLPGRPRRRRDPQCRDPRRSSRDRPRARSRDTRRRRQNDRRRAPRAARCAGTPRAGGTAPRVRRRCVRGRATCSGPWRAGD